MIQSVLYQNYRNWELIISDDASTDDTQKIIASFRQDKRIRYLRNEKNEDQLNALYRCLEYITGDIVMLLHSDDLLLNEGVLSFIVEVFEKEKDLDGIYADLVLVDKKGKQFGKLQTLEKVDRGIIIEIFLSLGANLVNDFFCVKRDIFFKNVVQNYVCWNTPYWINWHNYDVLRLQRVKPWYKYRQGDNYLSAGVSQERLAFVVSGCLRTCVELMYTCKLQYSWLFKILRRIPKVRRLIRTMKKFFVANNSGSLSSFVESFKNGAVLLDEIVNGLHVSIPILEEILRAPSGLIRNFERNKQILDIGEMNLSKVYLGKDARFFFEEILTSSSMIPPFYYHIIKTAPKLKAVRVWQENNVSTVRNVLRFLCLPLPILVGREEPNEKNLLRGFTRRFQWL